MKNRFPKGAEPSDKDPSPTQQSLWTHPVIWLIGGLFTLTVGANIIMISIAVSDKPDLVAPDYYEQAKLHDQKSALISASNGLNWKLELTATKPDRVILLLRVTDQTGAPVTRLEGTASTYRPSNSALDQTQRWVADPATPGLYSADLGHAVSGLWHINLDMEREGQRLFQKITTVLP